MEEFMHVEPSRNPEMEAWIEEKKNRPEVKSFLNDFNGVPSQEKAVEMIEAWNKDKTFEGQHGEVFTETRNDLMLKLKAYHFLKSNNIKFGYTKLDQM